MHVLLHGLASICLLVTLQACALVGSGDAQRMAKGISAAIAPNPDTFALTAMREYRVRPGDELQIALKGSGANLGVATVSSNGHASLPRKGDTLVQDMTLNEIASHIEEGHGGGVDVTLRAPGPVYVIGQVARPGQIAYHDGMTLGAVLTLMGGATHRADMRTVFITPRGTAEEKSTTFDETLPVLPGDIVRLKERYF